jgi:hypothetical protein
MVQLLEQRGFLADKTTPTFSFDPNNANRINQVDDLGLQSSRWQMLVLDILRIVYFLISNLFKVLISIRNEDFLFRNSCI